MHCGRDLRIGAIFTTFFCLCILWQSSAIGAVPFRIELRPKAIYNGTAALLKIYAHTDQIHPRSVRFLKKETPVIRDNGPFLAVLAIPLNTAPGNHMLTVRFEENGTENVHTINIKVKRKIYPAEYLKVPRKMVEFPPRTLARVLEDQKAIKRAVSIVRPKKIFEPPFLLPVKGPVKSPFGLRRFFNNKPRSPHSGIDIGCRKGTPVKAANTGVVVLCRNCYLSGKTMVIDHGLGIYSLYAHLERFLVKEGEKVKKGQIIGISGMSGRATGPHLHWGISVDGVRVDPQSVLDLFGSYR